MWEETHRKILEAVGRYLGLERDYVKVLVRASSRLDRSRRHRIRHHMPLVYSYGRTLGHIMNARRLRLWGDLSGSLGELGRALHLIHDSLIPGSKRYRRSHYMLERALAEQQVPSEALEEGFRGRPRTFKELKDMLQRLSHTDMDPESIMYNATYLSVAIVASVLLETAPPSNVVDSTNNFGHYCIRRLQTEASTNALILALLLAIITLTPLLPISPPTATPLVLAFCAAIAVLAVRKYAKRDRYENISVDKCREIVDEMRWFGLEVRRQDRKISA